MPTRDYKAPQFDVAQTDGRLQGQVAQSNARARPTVQVGNAGWRDKMFGDLLREGAKVSENMFNTEIQMAYLDGAAQAGVIKSEEEIEANPLLRDFQVGGYRAQLGKMELGRINAQFKTDIQALREQPPEAMIDYLRERREAFSGLLNSMPVKDRTAVAGQLAIADQAAVQQHAAEHAKFIIEKKTQALTTQWYVAMQGMDNAQKRFELGDISEAEFNAEKELAAGVIVGSVWGDDSLPNNLKQEITTNMLKGALENDSISLYNYFTDNNMQGLGNIPSLLTAEQQLALSSAARSAQDRNKGRRDLFRMGQLADLEAQINQNVYEGTYDQLDGFLTPLVQNGSISGDRRGGILRKYLEKRYDSQVDSGLAASLTTGDYQAILRAGKTPADAVKATHAAMQAANFTPEQQYNAWLAAGTSGFSEGFTEAGKQLGIAVRAIKYTPADSDGEQRLLSQHKASFQQAVETINAMEERGFTNTRKDMLKGLADEDMMFMERVLVNMQNNSSLEESVQIARRAETAENGLSKSAKDSLYNGTISEVYKAIPDLTKPRGLFATAWSYAKSVWPTYDGTTERKVRKTSYIGNRDGWFSDSENVKYYQNEMQKEIRSESERFLLLHPHATPDQVIEAAAAAVARRSVDTDYGPLVLPRGINLQAAFGVSGGNQAAIGPAISNFLLNRSPDNQFRLYFQQGELLAQEYTPGGPEDARQVGDPIRIGPAEIGKQIQADTQLNFDRANKVSGGGARITSKDRDISLQYNGVNTAGVNENWMFALRKSILEGEGLESKPYKDGKGMSVGAGIHSSNKKWYPQVDPKTGKITSEQATTSFLGATNDAAQAGAKYARSVGRFNAPMFRFMSEMAYQGGLGFANHPNKAIRQNNQELFRAIRQGDYKAAHAALRKTPQYIAAGGSAKEGYTPRETARQFRYRSLLSAGIGGDNGGQQVW